MGGNRTNGSVVRELEEQFAKYVGASYGIACCNGTATLHTALAALGVKAGQAVSVPPLTMASTTLAVLHAGARPDYVDVDPKTWLMKIGDAEYAIPVSLYGMGWGLIGDSVVEDAAESLNRADQSAFTSYSFQASKILSAGEGGMLVTNDPELYVDAKEFSRLGYRDEMISEDPVFTREYWLNSLKHPNAERHGVVGWNYRMSDAQARLVLEQLPYADDLLAQRRYSAQCYAEAIKGVDWITPQYVPDGWPHSYWTYAIALQHKDMWEPLAQAMQDCGGERPYAAWRITYDEPAFRHLGRRGDCPVAEGLQPRLVQLQTNHDRPEAERAAAILRKAIQQVEASGKLTGLTRLATL